VGGGPVQELLFRRLTYNQNTLIDLASYELDLSSDFILPEVNDIAYLDPLGFIGQPGFASCGVVRKEEEESAINSYPFLYLRSFADGQELISKFIYSDTLSGEWSSMSLGSFGQPIVAGLGQEYPEQPYSRVTRIGVYDKHIGMVTQHKISDLWYTDMPSYRYPLHVFRHMGSDWIVYLTPSISMESTPRYGLHATLWEYARSTIPYRLVYHAEAQTYLSELAPFSDLTEIQPFALASTHGFAGGGDLVYIAHAGANVGLPNESSVLLYGVLEVALTNRPTISFDLSQNQVGRLEVPNQNPDSATHRAFLGNDFEFAGPVTTSPISFEGMGCGVSYLNRETGADADKRIWLFELSPSDIQSRHELISSGHERASSNDNDQGFSLLSNPAHGRFEVTILETASTVSRLTLYDLHGRIISEINDPALGVYSLPQTGNEPLPAGIYLIRMQTEGGAAFSRQCLIL